MRFAVVLSRRPQQIDDIFRVPEVREIRHGGDDHFIGLQKNALRPRRPAVRQINGNERNVLAHDIDDQLASIGRNIVVAVEHDRSGEDREMLRTLRQQTVEQLIIEPFRSRERFRDALHRILIEIEPGRAEGEIEIGDRDIGFQNSPTSSRRRCDRSSTNRRRPSHR